MKDLSKRLLVLGLLSLIGLRVNTMDYLSKKALNRYAPYLLNIVIWGGGALAYRFYCNVNFRLDRNALIGIENRGLIEENGKRIDLTKNELKEEIQTNGKLLSSIHDQQDEHTKQLNTLEALSLVNCSAIAGTRKELLKKFSDLELGFSDVRKDMGLLLTKKMFDEKMSVFEQDIRRIKYSLNRLERGNRAIYKVSAMDKDPGMLPFLVDKVMQSNGNPFDGVIFISGDSP